MDGFKQPFMTAIFSVSSHHPFMVPEKYKGKFKKGPAPILEVVGYSDFALRELFGEISKSPWFKNTLFVITADHTNESVHAEFQNDFGGYCVPIIFYKPGSDLKGYKKRIAQQIDIIKPSFGYKTILQNILPLEIIFWTILMNHLHIIPMVVFIISI